MWQTDRHIISLVDGCIVNVPSLNIERCEGHIVSWTFGESGENGRLVFHWIINQALQSGLLSTFLHGKELLLLWFWMTWGWVNKDRFLGWAILLILRRGLSQTHCESVYWYNVFSHVKVSSSHGGWQVWNYYGKCSKPPSFPLIHLHALSSIRCQTTRAHMPNMPGLLCMTKTADKVCNILRKTWVCQ